MKGKESEVKWSHTFNISFVDRDMVMRYHWGLGVGHVYSHSDAPSDGSWTSDGAGGGSGGECRLFSL